MHEQGRIVRQSISRATGFAVGLAVLAIVLFIVLWIVLGQAGLDMLPRLVGAFCIPPAVIAAIIGLYMLIARPNRPGSDDHSTAD